MDPNTQTIKVLYFKTTTTPHCDRCIYLLYAEGLDQSQIYVYVSYKWNFQATYSESKILCSLPTKVILGDSDKKWSLDDILPNNGYSS